MSERAFSLELKCPIGDKRASELSLKSELKDRSAFQCSDPNCKINLTCTNWRRTGKRYYFTPSSKDELHIISCTQILISEANKQLKKETELTKETIRKNGIIKMTKIINKAKSNIGVNQEDAYISNKGTTSNSNDPEKERYESRHHCLIDSFVELFKDVDVDHNSPFISINNSKVSLNKLFLNTSHDYDVFKNNYNITKIFYGKAIIKTAIDGNNMLIIKFKDSELPKINTNFKMLSLRIDKSIILLYLDKNKTVIVYFRGQLINNGTKFDSFNDRFYKDIYFK